MGAPASRRRRSRVPFAVVGILMLVVAAAAGAAVYVARERASDERRADAARAFMKAWERRDHAAMYELLSAPAKRFMPRDAFLRSYRAADVGAQVKSIRPGSGGRLSDDGDVRFRVRVQTRDFGELAGPMVVETVDENGRGRVGWTPAMRLPGLRGEEDPRVRASRRPRRGSVLAADGSRLADDPIGAGIAGSPGGDGEPPTGLERLYDERLGGRPTSTLYFGRRVIRRVKGRRGRSVHTTIRTGLTRTAQAALGDDVGGVAVIRPRDGAVLALGGLAVSAPQPPGSTFKIVTLAAALQNGVTSPGASFGVQTAATLSGVKLSNAGGEACGGSLTQSFAKSCNSVFAPMGAKVGARRLVATSERFGFNEQPRIPAAKPSTISSAKDLRDAIAVGSAAIGQEKDLATPLQMASVAATIANRGVRVRPRIVREEPVVRRRVVRTKVAGQIRDMMVAVVAGGTGRSAALPGVTVAGKTGTAELVATGTSGSDPRNTTAWFVAFAPASKPKVAVAVMLVGAGHGGTSAAPVARRVLQAAL
jgi:hypothetical protein